ncbi:MAG: ABC transporter permease [Peptococcaceae bacterium]|nr:ABC transporter permease [Peptococcaceae bacterium]
MLFLENIKLALASIRANKMRSFLTMLGIIIGIASVIAITSIGSSAQAVVSKEFESYGKNMMYVYINWSMTGDYIESGQIIWNEDIERLEQHFGSQIQYICPNTGGQSDVKVGRTQGKFNISGVAGGYDKSKKLDILYGRMITEADVKSSRPRVVIEKRAAEDLFNTENAVGKTLTMTLDGESRELTVVGIYDMETTIFSPLTSGLYSCFVPYTLLQANSGDGVSQLEIYVDPEESVSEMAARITGYLSRIKDQPEGFYTFESAEGQGAIVDQMLGTLSLAIGAIAAISLVVGGIGIMNIMLVSVTERTREIGIRKSLGARTSDILLQFLIESMIISAIGGVIGVLLGAGVAAIGMSFAGVALMIGLPVILLAVGFSALVGIFFGLYPARKAARLDPIEALRYE